MLEIAGLSVAYGQHAALTDVGLKVEAGEIVAILGANGAGKTTLLKAIAGLVRPRTDASRTPQVRFNGHDLLALEPYRIVEAGVALVPEGRGIFADLTVKENLELGAFARRARSKDQPGNSSAVMASLVSSGGCATRRSTLRTRARNSRDEAATASG